MRPKPLSISALLVCSLAFTATAQQVYEADNGLTASGSGTTRKVSLGGSLIATTGINLGNYNLNLTGTGNVGIRTALPGAPLHVYKNQSANYNPVLILEDGLADGYVMFQMKGTGRRYHLGVGNASEAYFGLTNKFFIWDQDAGTPRMVVDVNGNIGMGTTSPGARLSVAGASAGTSGLQFTQLNNTATAGTGNGKVLSLDASGNVILVNDVGGASTVWPLLGATGTNPATHFLGTADNQDLVFRTNNVERSRLLANGNLLLGTTTDNGLKLQVNGHISSKGLRLDPGENLYWQDANTSIRRTTENVLQLQEYTGLIRMTGLANLSVELKHPLYNSAYLLFPSDHEFAIKHHGTNILSSKDLIGGGSFIKLGAPSPQFADTKGVDLYIFGGLGGSASSGFDGGTVYIDGGIKGGATKSNGNILIGTQQGNVGIGTTTPGNRLSIAGTAAGTSGLQFTQLNNTSTAVTGNGKVLSVDASGHVILVNATTGGAAGWAFTGNNGLAAGSFIGTTDATPVILKANNVEGIRIGTNGSVGIGTQAINDAGYKLFVEGNIRSRKVRVDQSTWADYVFDKDYTLLSLAEVERYITQHKHLPDVPSAAEVAKEGLDLGDNQAVLLKKIEELTLYMIEQNKIVAQQNQLLKQQQARIEALEKKVAVKK